MRLMVKVLFDHNLPPRIARAINEIIEADGRAAFPLRDRCPTNTSDIDFFNKLGREWIVVSKDLANSRKKAERSAILANNIIAFYLSPALQKKKVGEQAAAVLWHWDKMLLQRQTLENGLFQLPENKGKIRSL